MSGGADDRLPVWNFAPRDGALQGPLELASFAGGGLRLHLGPGQAALAVVDDEPRTVWNEGLHAVRVGSGDGALPASTRLYLLAGDPPLACRWGEPLPLRAVAARGGCAFRIADPARFHAAFLRRGGSLGFDLVPRLLGALVQARLEELLAAARRAPAQRLASLTAGELADGWAELGVALVAFACDTPATTAQPAAAPAGQPVAARV